MIQNSQVNAFYILSDIPNPTIGKVYNFKNLKDGWHYGEGISFQNSTIDNAISLIKQAVKLAFYATDAFPGLDGEIMCTIYFRDHYLEFIIESDGSITFVREEGDEEVCYQEGLSLQDAKEKIKEFRNETWNIYESSIQNIIMTHENTDSRVLHSGTPEVCQVSQLSVGSAYWKPEKLRAGILENITWESQRSLQSFGVSQQRSYQLAAS